MRRKLLPLLLAVLISACTGNKTQQTGTNADSVPATPKTEQWDLLTFNKEKKLMDVPNPPNYTIKIEVVCTKGITEAGKKINASLAGFLFNIETSSLKEAMKLRTDSLQEEYTSELTEFYEPECEDESMCSYEFTMRTEKHSDAPDGVIAYTSNTYMYQGGAHGGTDIECINFDAATGDVITKDQLFHHNKLTEVKQLMEKQLMADNECSTLDELREKTSITMLGDVYVGETNFQLTKNGIDFVFNQYEIAPYAEGIITVSLSWQQLKDCLKHTY